VIAEEILLYIQSAYSFLLTPHVHMPVIDREWVTN